MNNTGHVRRARALIAGFLLLLAAGHYRTWTDRLILPTGTSDRWPPVESVRVLDATASPSGKLVTFPSGTSVVSALKSLGLEPAHAVEGKILTRASKAEFGYRGWVLRPMSQQERWVWRLPMDLNRVGIKDLEMIPGIGPGTAERIFFFISKRVWLPSVDRLRAVRGVGPHRLKVLDRYLEVEGEG